MKSKSSFVQIVGLTLLLAAFTQTNAQNYQYSFKSSTGVYEELGSPTIVNNSSSIEETYNVKIPFVFTIYGRKVDFSVGNGITIYREGYLVDANITGSVIEAYYAFLQRRDETSSLSYEIVGVSPNRILKFQWKNMGLSGNPQTDSVNIQVWLHEKDSVVSMHMGPSNVTSNNGFSGIGTGKGPEIGLLRYDGISAFPDKYELIGDPDDPTLVKDVFRSLDGVPKEGFIYTFYPQGQTISVSKPTAELTALLYPNPASTKLTVQLPSSTTKETVVVSLYDMAGKNVKVVPRWIAGKAILDISKLVQGKYLCEITQGVKRSYHKVDVIR